MKRACALGPFATVTLLVAILSARPTRGAPGAPAAADVVADYATVVSAGPAHFGTNTWWFDEDAGMWTARYAELGSSVIRYPIFHGMLEPANDNEDPSSINWDGLLFDTPVSVESISRTITYSELFVALREQPGLHILIYVPYLAPWLSDNPPHPNLVFDQSPFPPNDLAEYREFVEALLRYLVETLEFPPERILFEAMNEPDLWCEEDPVVACFWDNATMADVADVVRVSYEAIQSVDPAISLIGLAECCGTGVVRQLMDEYPEGSYLEGLSYHYYAPSGFDLSPVFGREAALAPYGLPLYLDEYGNMQVASDGSEGALWHSWALPMLWMGSVSPVQYAMSDMPLINEPFSSMGLLEDWGQDWEPKPSYWVHVNFFRFVAGGGVISHTAPSDLDVLVVRQPATDSLRATFWVVNRRDTALQDVSFELGSFPWQDAVLRVFDNLSGPAPVLTTTVTGSPLFFTTTVPARSSRTFVLDGEGSGAVLDHIVLDPQMGNRLAGRAMSFTLAAWDAYSTTWDVTLSGTYTIEGGAGGGWIDNVYTTEVAGSWIVTGAYGSQADDAILVVWEPSGRAYLPIALRDWIHR